ncbi:MAG: ATPase P [Deltaproteobacteria bacterium]|nr:ATPase P [Deltaproteobacteria bacterium]
MIEVNVPGGPRLRLERLVLDYNGTLALDGFLLPGAAELLTELAAKLEVHVLTADTFGLAKAGLANLPVKLTVLGRDNQSVAKLAYVKVLGLDAVCAVGNGLNDHLMVAACALGLAVVGPEGASQKTLAAADVVCPDLTAALGLLLNPLRLAATLRD